MEGWTEKMPVNGARRQLVQSEDAARSSLCDGEAVAAPSKKKGSAFFGAQEIGHVIMWPNSCHDERCTGERWGVG